MRASTSLAIATVAAVVTVIMVATVATVARVVVSRIGADDKAR
ncbi:hypothetical protein [Cupriavidus gilardii]|nr:hypothetical protein [Cupriavidus gilardii]